jgi:uncharacterized RDD family membrane protein YckC
MFYPYPYGGYWVIYAGFWRRAIAFFIDLVLLVFAAAASALLLIPLMLVAPEATTRFLSSQWAGPAAGALWLVFAWLYFAGFECSSSQATIGKVSMSIAVADTFGEQIGFLRASLRFLGKLITLGTLGIGFFIMLRDSRRRALHDRLAGTIVIIKEPFTLPLPE